MKNLRKLLYLVIFLFIFSASTVTVSAKSNGLNTVTQVQVTCHRGKITTTRVYTQPHKIEAILNYLRLLDRSGRTEADPELLVKDSYEIVLYDSNGKHSIYRQRANQFFSQNAQPWTKIPQEQGSLLYPILRSITTD